jgi:protein-S-isoprenylcysteine O-methyltransferase Ste14
MLSSVASTLDAPCMVEPPPAPDVTTVAHRLARLRVPLGFVAAAIAWWLAVPTRFTLAIGIAIASVGEALRFWAAGHLHKSREVTASGPYRYFAHPLYVGSGIMGLGVAVASGSRWVVALVVIYLSTTYAAAVRHEEAFLRQKFGARYDAYKRESWHTASPTRFSFGQALANREHRAVLGFVVAVLLLLWKATYNRSL